MIIYVIETDGGTKVGFTEKDDIECRLKSLQTGNVKVIKVLKIYIVKNQKKMETIIHYFLREYRVRGEFFNCTLNHIYNVIEECISLENLKDTVDTKSRIKRILLENYQVSNEKEYVKLKDIKDILKQNNIKEDIENVKEIVTEMFDGVEFHDRKGINYKELRSVFFNLKIK
jgi:hypothetical protein